MSKTRYRFKRLVLSLVAAAGCAGLAVVIATAPIVVAQDNSVYQPRIETSYRQVQEGNVTRLVPQNRVVFDNQAFNPAIPRYAPNQLPHVNEIGPLVERILSPSLTKTFNDDGDNDNGEPADPKQADTDQLKTRLEEMLAEQFDAMSDDQETQIKQLTERLGKLKSQHQARSDARDEIIRRRMNELLRKPDPLAWDPNASRRLNVNTLPIAPTPSGSARYYWPVPHTVPAPPQRLPSQPPITAPYYAPAQQTPASPTPASPTPAQLTPVRPTPIQPSGRDNRVDAYAQPRPTGTRATEYYIKAGFEGLYEAIGRSSVDQSAEAVSQLQQSVRRAEMCVAQASESLSTIDDSEQKRQLSKRIEDLKAALRTSQSMTLRKNSPSDLQVPTPSPAPDTPPTNADVEEFGVRKPEA